MPAVRTLKSLYSRTWPSFPKIWNFYRSLPIRYYINVAVERASWSKRRRNPCNYRHSSDAPSKWYLPSASRYVVCWREKSRLSQRSQAGEPGGYLTGYGLDVHGSIPNSMSRPDQLWGPSHSRVPWVPWGVLFSGGLWIHDTLMTVFNCVDVSVLNGKVILCD
jgi:hypothetical protein